VNELGDIFTWLLLDPMINFLIILTNLLFSSFGLAIIAFTIFIRVVTFPLTMRQLRQTRAMQSLSPHIQEIQKKYSDPKRRQQEMMKAYREAGVNPLGCAGPFALQMPVLIALFVAVRITLPESPEALERLSGHLYDWNFVQQSVPLQTHFLGVDLRTPNLVFVVLVAASTFIQSKTTVTVATDERARTQQQMLTIMMPVMLAFFALNLPSGVSLYWVVSGIVSIVFNVAIYGVPQLKIEPLVKGPKSATSATVPEIVEAVPAKKEPQPAQRRESRTRSNGPSRPSRSKRKNRRRRS